MDVQGARLLAARIRAGVRVGSRIEVTGAAETHERLRPGDRGVVQDIAESGDILVVWERGFVFAIDPDTTSFRNVAA
jgi:Domain of unknown function (DUF4314)